MFTYKKECLCVLLSGCVAILVASCKVKTDIAASVNKIVAAMDDASYLMDQNSAEFQNILSSLSADIANIDSDLSILIRRDIASILERAPAIAGQEFRCNSDFVGARLNNSLRCLQRDFMLQSNYQGSVPVPDCNQAMPTVCTLSPSAIQQDLNPQVLDIFGYDFDLGISAELVDSVGVVTDITSYFAFPSHYHATLNMSNSGIPNIYTGERINILYGNTLISSVSILQGETCNMISPGSRTLVLPGKNSEVELVGPVWIDVSVTPNGSKLSASIDVIFFYNKTFATRILAEYSDKNDTYNLFTAPPDRRISGLHIEPSDRVFFNDIDDQPNFLERGNYGLVKRFEIDLFGVITGGIKVVYNNFNVCTVPATQ